jgi:hypothetical protein
MTWDQLVRLARDLDGRAKESDLGSPDVVELARAVIAFHGQLAGAEQQRRDMLSAARPESGGLRSGVFRKANKQG